MGDKKITTPSPDYLWPTLFTIVLGLYGYAQFMPTMESARPKDDSSPSAVKNETVETTYSIPARLWEDPMGEFYQKQTELLQSPTSKISVCRKDAQGSQFILSDILNRPLLLPVMVPGTATAEDKELRMRTRYAVISALTTAGYQPTSAKKLNYFKLQIDGRKVPNKSLWVPYELFRPDICPRVYEYHHLDNAEYTDVVVCWLDEDQIKDNPINTINIIKLWFAEQLRNNKLTNLQELSMRIIGPSSSDVLLEMARQCAQNEKELVSGSSYIIDKLKIWSNTLLINTTKTNGLKETILYSPRATVEPLSLFHDDEITWYPNTAEKKQSKSRFKLEDVNWFMQRDATKAKNTIKPSVEFFPIIGTDWHLAHAIHDELSLRNAWPRQGRKDECVVLVTEKDTLYGRSIPLLFASMFPDGLDNRHTGTNPPLIVYKFVRGVDGSLASQLVSGKDKKQTNESDQRCMERLAGYDPEGNYQVDYLRRLGDEMAEWDKHLKKQGGRGILAIGVVGTDVYDKLLFLRALRKRFARTYFFTNDLDDNYCRPTELEYTQNLLVASHFGLVLHPSLQRDVAPFRDSYQTATFLAVLDAVDDYRVKEIIKKRNRCYAQETEPKLWPIPKQPLVERISQAAEILQGSPYTSQSGWPYLKPLVFEISRNGPYQLTRTGDGLPITPANPETFSTQDPNLNVVIHAPSQRELSHLTIWDWVWLFVGTVALVSILAVNITWVRNAVEFIFKPFVKLTNHITMLCRIKTRNTENADSKNSRSKRTNSIVKPEDGFGASHLALALILILIAVLAIIWLKPLIVMVWRDHIDPNGQPFALFSGISIWPSIILRAIAALLGFVFICVAIDKITKSEKEFLGITETDKATSGRDAKTQNNTIMMIWPKYSSWSDIASFVRKYFFLWNWKTDKNTKMVLGSYFRFGHPLLRLGRAVILTIIFTIFCLALMHLTDSFPNQPARGPVAPVISKCVLLASIGFMFIITFFVIDSLQICQKFVRLLGRAPDKWPKIYLSPENYKNWKIIEQVIGTTSKSDIGMSERQTILTIAKHSDTVNKLIWYPFIVLLFLMLARQNIFYGWSYPIVLMIVQLLLLAALFFHTWRLRKEADNAREAILNRLRDKLLKYPETTSDPSSQVRHKHFEHIISDIERQDEGAFSHWTQDYFLKAMTLPLLGEGGFALLGRFLGTG